MIDTLNLATALGLPWLAAYFFLRGMFGVRNGYERIILVGYSYPLGMIGVTLLARLSDLAGLGINYQAICLFLIMACVVAVLAYRQSGQRIEWINSNSNSLVHRVLYSLLLMLIALRLGSFAFELVWRPIYPWDSWLVWAPRARIWFELKTLVPIVSPGEWWREADIGIYTTFGHTQPVTVSLIQTWIALSVGRWDESLINLPWLFCLISMGLAAYGQARQFGISALSALTLCYILISLPMLGVHVALGGYADIWMAAVFLMAVMAMLRYFDEAKSCHLYMALLFAPLPLILKKSGSVLCATLIPVAVQKAFSFRAMLILATIGIVLLGFIAFSNGVSITVSGLGVFEVSRNGIMLPGLPTIVFKSPMIAWDAVFDHYYIKSSWHLLWFFVPVLVVAGIVNSFRQDNLSISMILLFLSIVFVFAFVFFFTNLANQEYLGAAINRATLFFAPALTFCCALWAQRFRRRIFDT